MLRVKKVDKAGYSLKKDVGRSHHFNGRHGLFAFYLMYAL